MKISEPVLSFDHQKVQPKSCRSFVHIKAAHCRGCEIKDLIFLLGILKMWLLFLLELQYYRLFGANLLLMHYESRSHFYVYIWIHIKTVGLQSLDSICAVDGNRMMFIH